MAPTGRTCLLRHPDGTLTEVDLSSDDLSQLKAEPGVVVWLDLADPDADDLGLLRHKLQLHDLAIEDLEKHRQRPKIDIYPGQHVLVAYEVIEAKGNRAGFSLGEVHLIIGTTYLVSVHWQPSPALDEVRKRWRREPDAVATSAGGLLYAVLDTIADGYFPLLDRLSERIDRLQDSIIAGGQGKGQGALREVLQLKRQLLDLRRIVAPLRDVAIALLRRDLAVIEESLTPYFQDLYDHLVRVLDNIDLDREMLAAALDANLSVTNNNLNVIVKRLTAFTVILMIPTLIAGVYGMNFRFMPELFWPFGYAFALGLMLLSMIGAYLLFRARDWF
jgi:magnesium transporter